MRDRTFQIVGACAAAGVAALSLLYAVAYLGIAPAAQRKADADRFFRSYLAHPTGLRIASVCLLVSGPLVGAATVALAARLAARGRQAAAWAAAAGVVVGLATAAHGLGDLIGTDKLAHRYATGDAAVRASVIVSHQLPSSVDPRGLMTFGVAGLVVATLGLALRHDRRGLGRLGVVLGLDMVALFVASATGVDAAVLVTGGLASVVLGPVWWVAVARLLTAPETPEPAADLRPPAPPAAAQSLTATPA